MTLKPTKTKEEIKQLQAIVDSTKMPNAQRKEAALALRENMMSPFTDFNPQTFDPMEGAKNYQFIKRVRKDPERRLPNQHGIKPKEILDGQMVGMYESKQDLYLLIAALYDRVSDLEDHLGINQ